MIGHFGGKISDWLPAGAWRHTSGTAPYLRCHLVDVAATADWHTDMVDQPAAYRASDESMQLQRRRQGGDGVCRLGQCAHVEAFL